ncbi:hypothetical protein [Arthrobacter antibioticus]|uniref:hypothetical protein n=1 Tax=Arthrobacter sp. H35-MC1 TaxID=3046203 RepID=UPI0024BB3E08|nr:hypothetical protein [Arthrobacter sp. H35-MC1]MDJ0318868.1 hypothetical protein [Arthrobacter sp. H35-MC1]
MDEISVATTAHGLPVSFLLDGRTWHVGADPVRWFERVSWWETAARMPKGECVRMDVMVWQVQARIGHNSRSPLVTFHLVLGQDRRTWSVRSMDAIAA